MTPQLVKRTIMEYNKRVSQNRAKIILDSKKEYVPEMLTGLTHRQSFEVIQTLLYHKLKSTRDPIDYGKFNTAIHTQ